MTSPVALVLDPAFGDRLLLLAHQMPVWIVSSEENERAVARARRSLGGAANITTLLTAGDESGDRACLRGLYEIDEHHGPKSSGEPYDKVLVFGCEPDLIAPTVMHELGFERINKLGHGFTAEKQGPAGVAYDGTSARSPGGARSG